jgi:hypothetical protein
MFIGSFVGLSSETGDGNHHGTVMHVDEHIAGAPVSGDLIVLQWADNAELPAVSAHLHAKAGQRYLLVVNPSTVVEGAWTLILDHDANAYGWALEVEPGLYQIPAGPRRLPAAALSGLSDIGG